MSRYTSLSAVKLILRLGSSTKVRFSSNAMVSLNLYEKGLKSTAYSSTLIFNHLAVSIATSFRDKIEMKILFTSPTDYEVYVKAGDLGGLTLNGTGDILTPYIYNSEVTIPTTCWGGTINVDDVVAMVLWPHISDEDAEVLIEDVESLIDNQIFGLSGNVPYPDSQIGQDYFGGVVPQPIAIAAKKLASYYIFKSVFPDYDCEDGKCRFLDEWKRDAEKMIEMFIRQSNFTLPSVISFPAIINSIGTEETGFFKLQDSSDGVIQGWDSEEIFRRS